MLSPDTRQTLLDALRPPPGFRLGCAVGTSFSLNLDAALTAPAAFALYAVSDVREPRQVEPLELLDSLRRHAGRFTVFFQAGQVAVPAQRRLFAYLEGALVPVEAPNGGVFHPKVWVLRFESSSEPPAYRALCSSRNLTYDQSWDTVLRIDSSADDSGGDPTIDPSGLAAFVRRLPELAVGEIAQQRHDDISELGAQLEHIRWTVPPGAVGGSFVPLGLETGTSTPFPTQADRLAVVSPFLTPGLLHQLPKTSGRRVLVSRPEELNRCAAPVEDCFDEVYTLDPDAIPDLAVVAGGSVPTDDPSVPFEGLHAKLYVFDHGASTTVFTGSANATGAAFGANVELLTRLDGKRSVLGVEALLAEPTQEVQTLRTFLVPFQIEAEAAAEPDEELVEDELDRLRRLIAGVPLVANVVDADGRDQFLVRFVWTGALPELPEGVAWRCWPISRAPEAGKLISSSDSPAVDFPVSFEGITAFLANELTLGDVMTRFVLSAELRDAPADRATRLLRILLGDAERFLRYLLMLLGDEVVDEWSLSDLLDAIEGTAAGKWRVGADTLPLLEALLRTLGRDPERLEHVHHLIVDLCKDAEGQALLPRGLLEIWEPIWAVAEEVRG